MPVGLQIINPSGELTVSADAKLLHMISKATLVQTVNLTDTQTNTDPSQQPKPGRKAGYTKYHITVPNGSPFILGMDLPVADYGTRAVGITNITYLGSDVFEITAYNAGSASNDGMWDQAQQPLDIWAFGWSGTALNNFGLQFFDVAGNLTADFAQPFPLFPKFMGNFRTTKVQTIPAMGRPVVIGMPGYYYADGQYQDIGYLNTYIKQMGFWNRSDATTLRHITRKLQQHGYGDEFPTDDRGQIDSDSWAIVIDGSYLP